jgi:type IV pilus assembly protein PilO
MMSKLTEMPFRMQIALVIGIAVALSAVFAFVQLKPMTDSNKAQGALLKAKQKENAELRPYRDKEKDLELKIATLKQQLEILKKIVPDEKEPDQFMHVMQDTAAESGIEIRRYASRTAANKEFYTEAPFDIELDGPYYSLLDFFERVGKLERIINVSNLHMSTVKKPMDARVKKTYAYAADESTVASCLATTFFSHEPEQKPAPPAKK